MKTVWVKAHGGSNPSACAKLKKTGFARFFVLLGEGEKPRFLGGSREERETNRMNNYAPFASDDTLACANLPPPAPTKNELLSTR